MYINVKIQINRKQIKNSNNLLKIIRNQNKINKNHRNMRNQAKLILLRLNFIIEFHLKINSFGILMNSATVQAPLKARISKKVKK